MSGNDYKIEVTKDNFDFEIVKNAFSTANGVVELSGKISEKADVIVFASEKTGAGTRSVLCAVKDDGKIKLSFNPNLVRKEGLTHPNIWLVLEDATSMNAIKDALKR